MMLRPTAIVLVAIVSCAAAGIAQSSRIGREVAVGRHLMDGEEFLIPLARLVEHGRKLFTANWTDQDGAGRPLTKGTGKPLVDASQPLSGLRTFNRVSGPDANSCAGCHRGPYGSAGGGGDVVANVFVGAERFDFATFDRDDMTPTRGTVDEVRRRATLRTIGNPRATTDLFGAGYLEMLARQITGDLQRARDSIPSGESKALVSKGISFGTLARRHDGTWDTSGVEGLPPQSLLGGRPDARPSLTIRPWHQSGTVVSLRDFANTAFNQHHGIQTTERFGVGTDPDGDGVVDEMTRADVTAAVIFMATLPVPGRVIPNDPDVERAVVTGERLFVSIGCGTCHVPALPLDRSGWIYTEASPSSATAFRVDLTSRILPQPRLAVSPLMPAVVHVPAYTDFKLHDITDAGDSDAREALDINQPPGSPRFRDGNRKFLTRRLWGAANDPPYFHHGLFTTLGEAALAHSGEAFEQRRAFERLNEREQAALIEFLRSLQVLPPGLNALVVDEQHRPKRWPPT